MSLAISVEGLSKQYRLGLIGAASLREGVNRWWHRVRGRKVISLAAGEPYAEGNIIWALRNLSFQVDQGDAVGIIGRNGAGKSTLLKILSGITAPTSGFAKMKGRVASLLEVGAGFHSELSGRDNVYLNGVILGMTKAEVGQRFDEIVAFSEIEKFIDTPVKHYSSGMYVRLAFAVAAHVDAEILLVDEALAVGDAVFQNKCISRMKELRKSGRTVFFVSHNLPLIESFCKYAYLLEGGNIAAKGDPQSVIEAYYKLTFGVNNVESEVRPLPEGSVKFLRYETGSGQHYVYCGSPCSMKFYLLAKRTVEQANFGFAIWANDGTLLWAMRSLDYRGEPICLKEGLYGVNFSVPSLPLRPGSYQIQVSANDLTEGTLDSWFARPKLVVLKTGESGLPSNWQGILDLKGEFELTRIEEDQTLTKES